MVHCLPSWSWPSSVDMAGLDVMAQLAALDLDMHRKGIERIRAAPVAVVHLATVGEPRPGASPQAGACLTVLSLAILGRQQPTTALTMQ